MFDSEMQVEERRKENISWTYRVSIYTTTFIHPTCAGGANLARLFCL